MKINPKLKGYIYSFIATIALANVYIFSKAAMKEIDFGQFAFYWFGMAIVWNFLYILWRKKLNVFKTITKALYFIIFTIGIFEVVGTICFFYAIKTIENPANVSFLANLVPIFIIIIGTTFLKERFNYIEIIGIILTLGGTILISYKGNTSINEMFLKGSGIIVIASFSFAIATIISKKHIKKIDPILLSLNRVVYLFVIAFAFIFIKEQNLIIPKYALYNITVGSILGPFLTAIASYTSLVYIEASRSSMIQSTKGLFVVAGAIIYFGILPFGNEIIGGLITIIGVILISVGRPTLARISRRKIT